MGEPYPLPTGWRVDHQVLSNQFRFPSIAQFNSFADEILRLQHTLPAIISATEIRRSLEIQITIYGNPVDTGSYREKIDHIFQEITEDEEKYVSTRHWWGAFYRKQSR